MNTKKALPSDIDQFFKGESVFFQATKTGNAADNVAAKNPQKKQDKPKEQAIVVTRNHATIPPQNQVITPSSPTQTIPSANQSAMLPAVVEEIRKTVKHIGKEAATYRLTEAEKQQIADIVYTYKRQGYRTSDNELARIAINWLLLDYQEQGAQSTLARVLDALHQ